MARGRNRKRPELPFPPDAAEIVSPTGRRRDTRRWCRGIVGREHNYAEPLLAALCYAERRTGLFDLSWDERNTRYGRYRVCCSGSYMILECEYCGKQKYAARNIWRRSNEKVPGVEYPFWDW